MTYAAALQFLYDLQTFGLKLGLENTRRLAALAGNPQDGLKFIHVAGTNGKGSVCAMLESVYRAAGLKVGLFTSPHLVAFGERIQVNRRPIGEPEIVAAVTDFQRMLREFPVDHSPTFFETVTVLALRHFAACGCDLVIWETGMGGRLDATNIVNPRASLITNVSFDHEKWLGHTLPQIAMEKAGIIKPGVPVLTSCGEPDALEVIRETASRLGSPLVECNRAMLETPPWDGIRLGLAGAHQRTNAALALAAIGTLQAEFPVASDCIAAGFREVHWPGRMQEVIGPDGQRNLLDGAHNPAGAAALREVLDLDYPNAKPVAIVGLLEDKDWPGIGDILAPATKSICLTPVASARTASPEELRSVCAARWPRIAVSVCHSLPEAFRLTHAEPFRVVTGSLYLVGEALEWLGALDATENDERGLNDYGAATP